MIRRLIFRFGVLGGAFWLVAGAVTAQPDPADDDVAMPVRKRALEKLSPSVMAALKAPETTNPLRADLPDPFGLRALSANFDPYPDAALFDNSDLLEAPAGARGFVVPDAASGTFHYEDGTRARFWGVTITQEHIDIPKDRIDQVVDVLARAGCNMVRFHSLDNRAGEQFGFIRRTIIDESSADTQSFDAEYLDRFHYWIARLKQRGIYTYIVLRGFRHYREADGVAAAESLPRGATPYAFFNPRLIILQQQYAQKLLLDTVNPYTGLAPGNDPAVALVELFNEDSLFARPERWQKMLPPYDAEFRGLWNAYLKENYRTTAGLRDAWLDTTGTSALTVSESLEAGTVGLPSLPTSETYQQAMAASTTDVLRSPIRRRDAVRFAMQVQSRYFKTMSSGLRDAGLRVPITGVVAGPVIPDTYTVARDLDFTGENMYLEHPAFEPGLDWNGQPHFKNQNPLASLNPSLGVAHIARYRWAQTPLAVREWNTCWPNSFRSTQMPEYAAYARFQDWDCMLAFGYFTTTELSRISAFGIQNDPTRWGLFAQGARIFLEDGIVAPAKQRIRIRYSPEDLATWGSYNSVLQNLAYQHGLENAPAEADTTHTATRNPNPIKGLAAGPALTITVGRSHDAGYTSTDALLFSNGPLRTQPGSTGPADATSETLWARSGYPLKATAAGPDTRFVIPGMADETVTTSIPGATTFEVADLKRMGLRPLRPTSDAKRSLGAEDPVRRNLVFGRLPIPEIPRIVTEWMRLRYESPTTLPDFDKQLLRSDTGEIIRDAGRGLLFLDTDQAQMIGGALTTGTTISTPSRGLTLESASAIGTCIAISLDGQPLDKSNRFSLKFVTVAGNRNQRLAPAVSPRMAGYQIMLSDGTPPIVTGARHTTATEPTRIRLGERLGVSLYMENGTFEMLVDLNQKSVAINCDLPNARIALELVPPGSKRPVEAYALRAYQHETPTAEGSVEVVPGVFTYPGWAKVITLRYP